jgi:hypothetical protein
MKEITLSWAGKEYVIPASKGFQIGEQIEEIVTLAEVVTSWQQRPRMFKLARCYAAMLRFAGCRAVTDAQVFQTIMGEDGDAQAASERAAQAMNSLIEVLMGGAPTAAEGEAPGKTSAS